MSALSGKNVLIVGDANTQTQAIETALETHGMEVTELPCGDVTQAKLAELKIDLVVLNYLTEADTCRVLFDELRKADVGKLVPVFALVQDDGRAIEDVLTLGAADYITEDEDPESIVQKMLGIFGQGDGQFGNSVIDISPVEADVTATGIRVYVVEDDPLLRNLLAIQMDRSSFPYEFSSDGAEAVPAIKQFKPDVIILDLMLPGRSGFDVLAEIKDDASLADIPVVVFSNRDGQDDRKRAEELGAVGFYVKAMTDLSELIKTIEGLAKR